MPLIKSTFFPQKKSSSSSAKTASTGFAGTSYTSVNTTFATEADKLSFARNIWGQPFDGTADITGSFLLDNASASMQVYAPFKAGSYYAKEVSYIKFLPTENASENSNFYFKRTDVDLEDSAYHFWSNDSGNVLDLSTSGIMQKLVNNTVNLSADGLNFSNDASIYSGGTLTISAAESINMDFGNGTIAANTGRFNNITDNGSGEVSFLSPVAMDEGLRINGDLSVQNLSSQNIRNSNDIVTRNLTVTGVAHFFDLEIDRINHAGGQLLLSAASLRVDLIEEGREVSAPRNFGVAGTGKTDYRYKTLYLYMLAEDENGQQITNDWQRYDQIVCWTSNVSNRSSVDIRHWWTLVYQVYPSTISKLGPDNNYHKYHRIEIVKQVRYREGSTAFYSPATGEVHVELGDECCLLGSQVVGSRYDTRRNAIMIASVASFDTAFDPPCFVQYENINSFSLAGKAKSWFASNSNRISGELIISNTSESVESVINAIRNKTYFLHTAYAMDDEGTGFVHASDVSDTSLYKYIGLCTDDESDDSDYPYTKYTWSRINMDNTERDKLIPIRERLYLNSSDNLVLDVAYYNALWLNSGNTITAVLSTYGGGNSERNVNDTDTNQVYYTNTVQSNWSNVSNNNKYAYCTVYLKDANNNILDQHSLSVQFEAGAVLAITDSIKSRVSDAEGNISTLTQTATSLTSRIGTADSSISILEQTSSSLSLRMQQAENELALIVEPDSVYVELASLQGDVNQLQITTQGLTQNVTSINSSINNIQTTQSTFEAGISGLTSRLDTVEQEQSEVSGSLTTVREQQSLIEQKINNITLSVSDKTVGGENILYSADFGKINDSLVKEDWYSQNNFIQNHPSGRKSSLIAPSKYGPLADGTVGFFECYTDPTNVEGASDLFHYDSASGFYLFEMLRQELTGRLKPSTWYCLSMYLPSSLPSYKNFYSYIYPNVGNPRYKYYINGQDAGYCPSDVHVDWRSNTFNFGNLPSTNGWKRVSVVFKTRDDLSLTGSTYILFRPVVENNNGSHPYPYYAVAQPKLEEGQYATQFSYSQKDLESYIKLTAGAIRLAVKDDIIGATQINIESGRVIIDANKTEVTGNLNIYDGLTIYDDDNIARVQIQPQSVGSISDYGLGAFSYMHLLGDASTNSATNFIVNTDPISIELEANQQISIVNPIAYLRYNQQYCTASSANIILSVQKGNTTIYEKSFTVYLDLVGTSSYAVSSTFRFTTQEAGPYYFSARLTCSDQVVANSVMHADLSLRVEYAVNHHTMIGLDGLACFAGETGDKNLFVGKDGVRLQQGGYGLRYTNNKQLQVGTGVYGSDYKSLLWIPFYNYAPIFKPTWTYGYIPNIGETKYMYRINPETDFGDCYIDFAPRNANWNKQEGWIILPEENFTSGGVTYTLPIGYRVKIINATMQDESVTIYVTSYTALSNSINNAVIIDSNRNFNKWSRLRDEQSSDTYIWTGNIWVEEHDPQ